MENRFTNIMNEINALGKEYPKKDIAVNIIRSLPEKWDGYTVTLRNSKDLSPMSAQQMFFLLKAQEFDFNRRKPTKKVTTDEPSSSEKGVAFKAKTREPESSPTPRSPQSPKPEKHSKSYKSQSKAKMREELSLMAKRFEKLNSRFSKYKRFYKDTKDRKRYSKSPSKSDSRRDTDTRRLDEPKARDRRRDKKPSYRDEGSSSKRKDESDDESNKCYQYKKSGDIQYDCSQLSTKERKERQAKRDKYLAYRNVMLADEENSVKDMDLNFHDTLFNDSSDDDVLCLMARVEPEV